MQTRAAVFLSLLIAAVMVIVVCVHSQFYLPTDCDDIQQRDSTSPSGVYTIFPGGPTSPVHVYCDMDTDGGGWTVIQKRVDGTVNFHRPWDHYKNGFGDAAGEYWIGLDNIYLLTTGEKKRELRVDMEDWEGGKAYAQYSSFSIDPETSGYQLRLGSYVGGAAGDSLTYHSNNMNFTTYDKDQDISELNCAQYCLSGFWFGDCAHATPNGLYWLHIPNGGYMKIETRMIWFNWKSENYPLKSIAMKIRCVAADTVSVKERQEQNASPTP